MKAFAIIAGIAITAIVIAAGFLLWLGTSSKAVDEMIKAENDQFPS